MSKFMYFVKKRVAPVPKHHVLKEHRRCGGKSPHILDLSTRCRWNGQFHAPSTFSLGTDNQYSLDRTYCIMQKHIKF